MSFAGSYVEVIYFVAEFKVLIFGKVWIKVVYLGLKSEFENEGAASYVAEAFCVIICMNFAWKSSKNCILAPWFLSNATVTQLIE